MFTQRRLLLAPGVEMSESDLTAMLNSGGSTIAIANTPTAQVKPSSGPFAVSETVEADEVEETLDEATTVTTTTVENVEEGNEEEENYDDIDSMFKTKERVTDALMTSEEKAEAAKAEAAKTKPKSDEETDETDEPATHKLVTNARGKKVVARDYSDIPEQDRELAKNMSGAAFQRFKAALKREAAAAEYETKLKELEADKAALKSSLDHPDAYQLTPEYTEAVNTYTANDAQVSHLRKSLEQIALGNDFEPLGYQPDEKGNMRLVRYPATKATAAAQAEITVQLQQALAKRSQAEDVLRNMPQQFQQQRQQYVNGLNTIVEKGLKPLWAGIEKQESAKKMQARLLSEMPSLVRRQELAEPFTQALTLIYHLAQQMSKQQAAVTNKQFVAKERLAAGNVSSGKAAAGGKAKVTTGDLYDDAEELFASRFNRR